MARLMGQLTFVVGAILLGAALGAWTGREVGRRSPSIVRTIAGEGPVAGSSLPHEFRPDEFGLGLGALSGLFLGGGASLFLIALQTFREASAGWPEAVRLLARARAEAHHKAMLD